MTSSNVGGRRYDYEQDATGVWNLFIPYPGPGVRYVTVYVHGVGMPEPGTDIFYSNGWKAAIESPAPAEAYYAIRDVPHGDVREHWFRSGVTGTYRRMFVYTPPGYDQDAARHYPVLYLQHGAGEMEQEWTHSGLANFILDNLIADRLAVPMIVVMNNGFANRPGEPPAGLRVAGGGAARAAAAPAGAAPTTAGAPARDPNQVTAFEEVLIREAIPDIDRNFRTIADREHRALAGLSMGGGQAYQIGLRNLDTFSCLGMVSGAIGNVATLPEPMNDPPTFNRRVHAFFLSAGNAGGDLRFHTIGPRRQGQHRGHSRHLLRIEGYPARVADLAPEPPRLRPTALQGVSRSPAGYVPGPAREHGAEAGLAAGSATLFGTIAESGGALRQLLPEAGGLARVQRQSERRAGGGNTGQHLWRKRVVEHGRFGPAFITDVELALRAPEPGEPVRLGQRLHDGDHRCNVRPWLIVLIARLQCRAPESVIAAGDVQREDAVRLEGSRELCQVMARGEIEIRVQVRDGSLPGWSRVDQQPLEHTGDQPPPRRLDILAIPGQVPREHLVPE